MQEFALTMVAASTVIGATILARPHLVRWVRAIGLGLGARRFGASASRRGVSAPPPSCRSAPSPALPERLTRDEQWSRAARVIADVVERTGRVEALQLSAAQQLDSATYAIQRLWAELGSVIPDAAERVAEEPAVVHAIVPARHAPASGAALAA